LEVSVQSNPTYYLDPDYLSDLAEKNREAYQVAEPFPHIVIDNFLPEAVLDEILNEFPKADGIDWQKFDASAEKKLASKSELQMGEITRSLLYQLNASTFITFLERLTSIDGLIPDPHFVGGGLHQIERGGFLKMHVDFNRHGQLRLDRRLNLLIYLNKDWEEAYGGHLELWDKDVTQCSKKILPIFNRCVVFTTTDFSYHGHPEPLNCPGDRSRKSLALYYYSNGRPASEIRQDAPEHSTLFRERPGETIAVEREPIAVQVKSSIKRLLPMLNKR
jgi:Rps23 Pro-64 3,4-dihydroxylase Tpa1-like proline 4-hydroxylase